MSFVDDSWILTQNINKYHIYHMYLRVGSHWCVYSGVAPFLQWMSSLGSFSVKSIGAQATQLPVSMVCPRAEQFNQLMTDSVLLVWEFLESFWLISLYRFNNVTAFWAQTLTVHTLWKSTSAAQLHQSCHGPIAMKEHSRSSSHSLHVTVKKEQP